MMLPSLDISYIKNDLVDFYGVLSVGSMYNSFNLRGQDNILKSYKEVIFAYQIYPIGLKVGRQFGAFTQIGYGYRGLLAVGIFFKLTK